MESDRKSSNYSPLSLSLSILYSIVARFSSFGEVDSIVRTMAFRRLSSVVVLVAAVLWAVGTHVCEAFPSKLTKGHIYHSQHSSLLSKVWTSHFTSTDSSLFLPHSVPRKPTAGTVLILTESTVKSATIRHLLMQYSPASFLSQQQFVLKTCPETITTLAKTIRSPRPTLKNSAELDFSVAIDAALNPAYELVQSKSTRDTLRDIQDTFREKNVTKLVVAFNMDREGDVLMWHLLSVLKVPENVTISRLRLSELTPNLFQKALTNALSPTTDDKVLFDMNFIDSQLVRRVVDRTISFVLAQALHKCLGCYYSVGRVQSSVLNHIVEVSYYPQLSTAMVTNTVTATLRLLLLLLLLLASSTLQPQLLLQLLLLLIVCVH